VNKLMLNNEKPFDLEWTTGISCKDLPEEKPEIRDLPLKMVLANAEKSIFLNISECKNSKVWIFIL